MERIDPHATQAAADEPCEPLAHLACGLVGESHRENVPGGDAKVVDKVRNTVGEHARLAASGARQNEKRSLTREDRLGLGFVK